MTVIKLETKPKKNLENFGPKRWIKIGYLGPVGWLLVASGFILLPFFIGLPILILGWLILLFNLLYSWYTTWIPYKLRQELTYKLKQDYQPYRPAARSLSLILWEIAKVAGFVFVSGVLLMLLGLNLNWW